MSFCLTHINEMKFLCLVVIGIGLVSTGSVPSSSSCPWPPCPDDEQQQQQPLHQNLESILEPQCCAQTRQELVEVNRNLTALWFTLSEFREVVARHLHHLHQHQMFTQHMNGAPPAPHGHSHRQGHEYRQDDHQHRHHRHHDHQEPHTHNQDPFQGLDVDQPPKAFKRPPKVRNPEEFDFAACNMRPNSALPTSQVHGIVYLSQKKNSNTVYIHLLLSGLNTSSTQQFVQNLDEKVYLHGFHVHEIADLSNGCESTGPHFNPLKQPHGGPDSDHRHIGDFGNIPSDSDGAINELVTDETSSLRGPNSIIGKPLVIHALEDDLGTKTNDPGSTTTGNSGARLACCIIEQLTIPTPAYRKAKEYEFDDLEAQIIKVHHH